MQFPSTPNLTAALAIAKLSFEPIIADSSADYSTKAGGRIRYDWAELDDIIPAITPALSSNGLTMVSQNIYVGDPSLVGGSGRLYLVTRLLHVSGESLESYYPLPLPGDDPKSFGIASKYGRRYNTLALLELSILDDEESKKRRRQKIVGEIQKDLTVRQSERSTSASKQKAQSPAPSELLLPALANTPKKTQEKAMSMLQQEAKLAPQYLHPKQNADIRKLRDRLGISSDFVLAKTNSVHPGNLAIEDYQVLAKDIAVHWAIASRKFSDRDVALNDLGGALLTLHDSQRMPFIDAVHGWIDSLEDDSPGTAEDLHKVEGDRLAQAIEDRGVPII
jgi:hypothetical protein